VQQVLDVAAVNGRAIHASSIWHWEALCQLRPAPRPVRRELLPTYQQ